MKLTVNASMLRNAVLAMTALATLATAQPGPGMGGGFPGGFPGGGPGSGPGAGQGATAQQTPSVTNIKAYLSLTDAQVQALQQIQTQLRTQMQTTQQEMQTKQTQLRDLLQKGSTDAAAVGRLVLDIEGIRRKLQTSHTSLQDQARNVLNADQKTKLKALEDAAKLQPSIHEATMLHLLTPPQNANGPMGAGFGPGFGPGSGPGFGGRQGGFGPRIGPPPPIN